MMKFGCNYSFWQNTWEFTVPQYLEMTNRLADCGFDVLEISADHLYHMSDEDIAALKAEGEKRNMVFSTNSGPAKKYDLANKDPEVRACGNAYFKKIFDNMVKLGSDVLVGAIYSYWPCDFVELDKEACWDRSIACLQELGDYAGERGLTIALEILNRNESNILTDHTEAIEYVRRVGKDAVKILLDTYHANIEEDDLYEALRETAELGLLAHVHVGENNRKLPGMNNSLDWPRIGKILRDAGYDAYVVMEPFLLKGGQVGKDVRVWRDLSGGADDAKMTELITTSCAYLKKCCLG